MDTVHTLAAETSTTIPVIDLLFIPVGVLIFAIAITYVVLKS